MLRLAINDFDMAAITNEVNTWKSNGKFANYDISNRGAGEVTLVLENVFRPAAGFFAFDIHKIGKKGFFGTKAFWVSQIYSSPSSAGPFKKHGCMAEKSLVKVLVESFLDVQYNFMSIMDFDLACTPEN